MATTDEKEFWKIMRELAEDHKKTEAEIRGLAEDHKKAQAEMRAMREEQEERWRKADEERAVWRREQEELWRKAAEERAVWRREYEERWRKADEERAVWRREYEERWRLRDGELQRINRLVHGIGANQGSYIEELFYRSLLENPVLGDIRFDSVERNLLGEKTEYDIVMENGSCVGLVEVKHKANPSSVPGYLRSKTVNFRRDFPEHCGKSLYFGLAAGVVSDRLAAAARKLGIFLLAQKGDRVEVVNEKVRAF